MSMDHTEGLGAASASEVPARPPGSGYNFRPRSRSATAPKNRRLGSVELQGVGSTQDLPAVTPPNSPTPSGAGNSTHDNEIHTRPTGNTGINKSTPIPNTVTVGVAAAYSTLVSHDSTTTSSLANSTHVYGSLHGACHQTQCTGVSTHKCTYRSRKVPALEKRIAALHSGQLLYHITHLVPRLRDAHLNPLTSHQYAVWCAPI